MVEGADAVIAFFSGFVAGVMVIGFSGSSLHPIARAAGAFAGLMIAVIGSIFADV